MGISSAIGAWTVMGRLGAILFCLLTSGCVVVRMDVTNPLPGMSKIAIVPFFNQSAERAADGRRFAEAYFAELQKVPGYQVLPIGVTETAITKHQLEMNGPNDVLKLADLLHVDAVVVGTVTDYSPYYPPRVGLNVQWYSPGQWTFTPGVQTDQYARKELLLQQRQRDNRMVGEWNRQQDVGCLRENYDAPFWKHPFQRLKCWTHRESRRFRNWKETFVIRAQSADGPPSPTGGGPPLTPPLTPPPAPAVAPSADHAGSPQTGSPYAGQNFPRQWSSPKPFDPHKPIMSYTRLFDARDADLVAALRDYLELGGDQSSGSWEAHLHRSEDFIRFTAHLMIVEMLTLHGGQGRRRLILKRRNFK